MLKRWFSDSAAGSVRARLEREEPSGWVAVIGDVALASALADAGMQVVAVDHRRRRLRRAPNPVLSEGSPVREVAALVAAHPGDAAAVESLALAVASGGLVILLGGDPRAAGTQALAGGLTAIEQTGKLTIGRVVHFH